MQKIAENCFYIAGSGICSNIYILHDNKVVIIIDSGDGRVKVKENADYCILTHGHQDHTGGVKEDWNVFLRSEDFREDFPYAVPTVVKPLYFNRLNVGSFDLEIIHTPGHTKGSICIFERNRKILFTGDTLFSDGWIGRTDLPGGDEKDLMNSLLMLLVKFSGKKTTELSIPIDLDALDLSISLLCPGHGDIKRF